MAVQFNGVAVPSSMASRGVYKFNAPAVVARNGQGQAITAGYASAEWSFGYMTLAEFAYWETTLLSGAASATLTNNRLWNRLMAETAYGSLVLYRPEFENYNGNRYRNVTIRIAQIVP